MADTSFPGDPASRLHSIAFGNVIAAAATNLKKVSKKPYLVSFCRSPLKFFLRRTLLAVRLHLNDPLILWLQELAETQKKSSSTSNFDEEIDLDDLDDVRTPWLPV